MIDGITQWMPLHLAGDLKSFYYPKKRDGLFKRSIYVAPGISALVSSSTNKNNPFAVKLLHRDKNVVTSYELEFSNFLSLCRPLMKIFSFANFEEYYRILEKFDCIEGDVYIEGSMPSHKAAEKGVAAEGQPVLLTSPLIRQHLAQLLSRFLPTMHEYFPTKYRVA